MNVDVIICIIILKTNLLVFFFLKYKILQILYFMILYQLFGGENDKFRRINIE